MRLLEINLGVRFVEVKGNLKMKKSLKSTFQPLEVALKKALGIRKVKKGQIFDSRGFVQDSREKITRFVLFIPLFKKIRVLISANSLWGGGIAKF